VRNGMGLGMLLCLLADDERDLVRLAEPVNELDTNLWILTHPAMKGIARIKAFTDSSMRSCERQAVSRQSLIRCSPKDIDCVINRVRQHSIAAFNHRCRKIAHLFQSQHKAILCDRDS